MNLAFKDFSSELFSILLGNSPEEKLYMFTKRLQLQGVSQELIYSLFLEFHKAIQIDPRTKTNEDLYNLLSDFMDTLVD